VHFFLSLALVNAVSIIWYSLVHYELLSNPVDTDSVIYRNPVWRAEVHAVSAYGTSTPDALRCVAVGCMVRCGTLCRFRHNVPQYAAVCRNIRHHVAYINIRLQNIRQRRKTTRGAAPQRNATQRICCERFNISLDV